jgi:hypothetical protein
MMFRIWDQLRRLSWWLDNSLTGDVLGVIVLLVILQSALMMGG